MLTPLANRPPFILCYLLMFVHRGPEKMKKSPGGSYYKKTPAPNHHSSTISPQPILQTEKTSLHDKGGSEKRRRSRDGDLVKGLTLPEVKGAEGQFRASYNQTVVACAMYYLGGNNNHQNQ